MLILYCTQSEVSNIMLNACFKEFYPDNKAIATKEIMVGAARIKLQLLLNTARSRWLDGIRY